MISSEILKKSLVTFLGFLKIIKLLLILFITNTLSLTKVLLIGATIKVLLTVASMTDYRKNGKFWSKPYENEILIKPDR